MKKKDIWHRRRFLVMSGGGGEIQSNTKDVYVVSRLLLASVRI